MKECQTVEPSTVPRLFHGVLCSRGVAGCGAKRSIFCQFLHGMRRQGCVCSQQKSTGSSSMYTSGCPPRAVRCSEQVQLVKVAESDGAEKGDSHDVVDALGSSDCAPECMHERSVRHLLTVCVRVSTRESRPASGRRQRRSSSIVETLTPPLRHLAIPLEPASTCVTFRRLDPPTLQCRTTKSILLTRPSYDRIARFRGGQISLSLLLSMRFREEVYNIADSNLDHSCPDYSFSTPYSSSKMAFCRCTIAFSNSCAVSSFGACNSSGEKMLSYAAAGPRPCASGCPAPPPSAISASSASSAPFSSSSAAPAEPFSSFAFLPPLRPKGAFRLPAAVADDEVPFEGGSAGADALREMRCREGSGMEEGAPSISSSRLLTASSHAVEGQAER